MRLHVVVRGRVQGVGFRWFVREAGRQLGLAGWVKNRPDGTVEVMAEGEPDEIEKLRARLSAGPPGAAVTEVRDVSGPGDDGALVNPFTILR